MHHVRLNTARLRRPMGDVPHVQSVRDFPVAASASMDSVSVAVTPEYAR